ncbi:poly(3-hydroxybutyrate) depolymerase [Paraburkholderia kururiensis]|uniref:polyhydroxyalkanoate depolymerase n=1 Tax=Paraburkholderia kururiensis TaxID=984307 RepID=UPI0039A612D4
MWYAWLEAQRGMARTMQPWAQPPSRASRNANAQREPCGASGAGSTSRAPSDTLHDAQPAEPTDASEGIDWLTAVGYASPEPPPFGIEHVMVDGTPVAVVEDVVARVPFCTLRRFRRVASDAVDPDTASAAREDTANAAAPAAAPAVPRHAAAEAPRAASGSPAVFLCPPLAGHHAVMLRETVETLLEQHDVYVPDWANARDVPAEAGPFGLDDYVLTLERFIRAAGAVHVLSVCQATVPALAAVALIAVDAQAGNGFAPLSVTLMGGPIDTSLHPTPIDRFAHDHEIDWFKRHVIDVVPPPYAGKGRRVYPGFIQHAALVAAHPHRYLELQAHYWASCMTGDLVAMTRRLRELSEYASVLDMTERYFLDTIRVIFQERLLPHGTWHVAGRRVALEALTSTALCTVEGDRDDIVGAGQTHAAAALCTAIPAARRMQRTIAGADHYDLFLGPRWREEVHPMLEQFWADL